MEFRKENVDGQGPWGDQLGEVSRETSWEREREREIKLILEEYKKREGNTDRSSCEKENSWWTYLMESGSVRKRRGKSNLRVKANRREIVSEVWNWKMTPFEIEFVARILASQIPPTNSGRFWISLFCFSQTQNLCLMEFKMMALPQIPSTNDASKHTIDVLKARFQILRSMSPFSLQF